MSKFITKNDLKAIFEEVLPLDLPNVKIGQIIAYAGSDEPNGWLKCDGRAVSRETYAALFSVIGTTFGSGDGSTTFNLPDLRDSFPVGAGISYDVGDTGGEATVTLDLTQIPAHSGHLSVNTGVPSSGNYSAKYLSSSALATYGSVGRGWNNNSNEAYPAGVDRGGSQAHNNMPPYVGVIYLIYCGGDIAPIITTLPMEDWIVGKGTSGIWTYKKWNSGVAECWGRVINCSIPSGWSTAGIDVALPFVFNTVTNWQIQHQNYQVNDCYGYPTTKTATYDNINIQTNASSAVTAAFMILCQGTWK